MKVTITKKGLLEISPENELEEYALTQWSEENVCKPNGVDDEHAFNVKVNTSCNSEDDAPTIQDFVDTINELELDKSPSDNRELPSERGIKPNTDPMDQILD